MARIDFRLAGPLLSLIIMTSLISSAKAQAPADGSGDLMIIHGYARLVGFYLTEPQSQKPLTQRHIEVITVVGEVDPPFVTGDDRVQGVNPEYNYPRFKNLMNGDPGMVTATMTVFVEEPSSEDDRVQLWEQIIVRVYDNEDKKSAKYYCDTNLWKAKPGFNDLTPEQLQFSSWKKIKKNKINPK